MTGGNRQLCPIWRDGTRCLTSIEFCQLCFETETTGTDTTKMHSRVRLPPFIGHCSKEQERYWSMSASLLYQDGESE